MPNINRRETNTKHEAIYTEILAVLDKYKSELSAIDILAITANIVGKVLALQDQRKYSPDMALKIIAANIEQGNAQALAAVQNTVGSG